MPRSYSRSERIEYLIQRELAKLVQFDVFEPKHGLVTISHVKLSADLSIAKVYFSLLDESEDNIASVTECLSEQSSYLRTRLASEINNLRRIPQLRFFYDRHLANTRHLTSLIEQQSESKT